MGGSGVRGREGMRLSLRPTRGRETSRRMGMLLEGADQGLRGVGRRLLRGGVAALLAQPLSSLCHLLPGHLPRRRMRTCEGAVVAPLIS